MVFGSAWVSNSARVYDNAMVSGDAGVFDNARVYGDAVVRDHTVVSGDAEVYGSAALCSGAEVCGSAKVSGNARVYGCATVSGDAQVYGYATVSGDAVVRNRMDYTLIKNFWSSGRWITYTRSNRMWTTGCFYGTGEELIEKAYADSEEKGKCYEAAVRFVEEVEKTTGKQGENNGRKQQ